MSDAPAEGRRPTYTWKLAGIGLLIIALLIPLSMIESTLGERRQRRDQAVGDITSSWGREQTVVGPVLVVPYRYSYKTLKDTVVKGVVTKVEVTETGTARAWFLPERLDVEGELKTEKLHRGIYDAVVYRGALTLSGKFPKPDFRALKVAEEQVQWDDAVVAVGVSDLRGTAEALRMKLGAGELRMSPGTPLEGFPSGVHAVVGRAAAGGLAFALPLTLKGSAGLHFAPLGVQNQVKLSSPWPDPSFNGQFLPAERKVSPSGFSALWKVSYYGRSYPQSAAGAFPSDQVQGSLFGVSFYNAVDAYRMVERAAKYGVLFLTLVFAAFFLYEVLAGLRVHPVQYTLVGAAMCLFYLALLSLSEFTPFGAAYLAAALASGGLITAYRAGVLRSGRAAGLIGAELGAIYLFLYVTLRLQDYSLLIGTAGLFAVLGAIMYATRGVDWDAFDRGARRLGREAA